MFWLSLVKALHARENQVKLFAGERLFQKINRPRRMASTAFFTTALGGKNESPANWAGV